MCLRPALLALCLPLLGGCNAAMEPAATAPAAYQSQRFPVVVLPAGEGCRAEIGRFDAVLKADYETGNVAEKVYAQIQRELQPARTACSSGDDSAARGLVSRLKARFGYPA